MTIDQIIALSASLGACFAAVATFLTVREMKRQRETSYYPELALSHVIFESTGTNNSLPTNWVNVSKSNIKDVNSGESNRFTVPLYNIGVGVAKEIVISWSFQINDVVKKINELAELTKTSIHLSLENGMLLVKSNEFLEAVMFWENERLNRFDYILPSAINKDPVMLKLPVTYMYVISTLIFLNYKIPGQNFSEKTPLIKVICDYSDISDTKHKSIFNVDFELHIVGGVGKEIFFRGSLNSRKSK